MGVKCGGGTNKYVNPSGQYYVNGRLLGNREAYEKNVVKPVNGKYNIKIKPKNKIPIMTSVEAAKFLETQDDFSFLVRIEKEQIVLSFKRTKTQKEKRKGTNNYVIVNLQQNFEENNSYEVGVGDEMLNKPITDVTPEVTPEANDDDDGDAGYVLATQEKDVETVSSDVLNIGDKYKSIRSDQN